jgi:ABC-type uncharacterized transport system permease subunit
VVAAIARRSVARAMFVALQVVTFPVAVLTSTFVLGVIYYLVVTPIGLALRLTGRDALNLKGRGADSLWVPVHDRKDLERSFRQF